VVRHQDVKFDTKRKLKEVECYESQKESSAKLQVTALGASSKLPTWSFILPF
jgi:hypothetical protein